MEYPLENGFAVDGFLQELHITGMQDIVVDASDDLLLVDEIGGSVALPVNRIEQKVLRNVYSEELLDVDRKSVV